MKKPRNWKTTLAGVAVLLLTGVQVAKNPSSVLHERTIETVVQGLVGIGLIKAADEDSPPQPEKEKE